MVLEMKKTIKSLQDEVAEIKRNRTLDIYFIVTVKIQFVIY